MWTRAQLKSNAKQLFYRNYWECVAVGLIMGFFSVSAAGGNFSMNFNGNDVSVDYGAGYGHHSAYFDSPEARRTFTVFFASYTVIMLLFAVIGTLVKIFIGNALLVGGYGFFIKNRTEKAKLKEVIQPFRSGHYGNVVKTMFLRDLYIFLWSLLFVIPGIIKAYEYLMVPYILAENPGMDRKEAFAISKRMMTGEKWNAFVLELSFFGWILLGVFTCGLLVIFFTTPYMEATMTELYAYNKVKAYNEGYIR